MQTVSTFATKRRKDAETQLASIKALCMSIYKPHQYILLGRAEIRNRCSRPQVIRDALPVQQLVGLLCRDIHVHDAAKDVLRGRCQHQREDVVGVIWAGRGRVNTDE